MSGSTSSAQNALFDPGSVAQQASIFGGDPSSTNTLSPWAGLFQSSTDPAALAAAAAYNPNAPTVGFGFGLGGMAPGQQPQQQQVAVNPSVQQMFDANGNPIPHDQWQQAINATPTPPSALDAVNNWANAQDKNVYGVDPSTAQGQQHLAILASAGFPMWQNPVSTQDQLAQMAQGTVQVPGISQQQAYDAFMRQVQGGAGVNPYGGGGGGPNGAEVTGGAGGW